MKYLVEYTVPRHKWDFSGQGGKVRKWESGKVRKWQEFLPTFPLFHFPTPHSTLHTPHSPLPTPHSTLPTPHFPLTLCLFGDFAPLDNLHLVVALVATVVALVATAARPGRGFIHHFPHAGGRSGGCVFDDDSAVFPAAHQGVAIAPELAFGRFLRRSASAVPEQSQHAEHRFGVGDLLPRGVADRTVVHVGQPERLAAGGQKHVQNAAGAGFKVNQQVAEAFSDDVTRFLDDVEAFSDDVTRFSDDVEAFSGNDIRFSDEVTRMRAEFY